MNIPIEVALPILIPLLSGAVSLAFWRYRFMQRGIGVLGTGALLVSAGVLLSTVWQEGILVMHMGGWQAPFGIVLVADLLSAFMVLIAAIIGVGTALYSLSTISERHEHFGYYPLMHLLLAGINGAFLTGDIFNLYVWFEVMLVASFSLLILGGERAQMEGAIKYVTINLVSSAMFLSAIGLLYGMTGTLNMADLAWKISQVEDTGMMTVVAMLFLVAFGIKAGAFPLFFWLPASYHTPRIAVSALFAGLLTKVGVYAMYRVFTLIFTLDGFTQQVMIWMAGATMLVGVLGAAAQFEFRRILAFHSISQIGYMIMGLALFTPMAIAGGIYFVLHHSIVKSNLFLVSGLVFRFKGTYELKEVGGVYRAYPMLALLFMLPALSLAGIPPLSGFVGKFAVILAGVHEQAWWLVAVALVVGLLTLYSMIKIWNEVFWKAQPEGHQHHHERTRGGTGLMYTTIALLATMTILVGIGAEPVLQLTQRAAAELLDPVRYIEAVLGPQEALQ